MFQKAILLISHELTYTGAPRCLYNLAKCLLEEGHKLAVWSYETGDFFAEFASLGLDVNYVTKSDLKKKETANAFKTFDLVIANTIFCTDAALEAQKYTRSVLFLGEARNISKIVSDFSFDTEKIRAVKNIVCVSRYAKKALEKYLGRKDIEIIHNYVENYKFRGGVDRKSGSKIRFIVSGTVEPRKGQDIAIEAYRSLPGELREKATLHIVGKAPAWSKKFFKNLKLGDGVFFHNEIQNRTELLEYYKKMDVFLVSSRDEACSMVALEAAMLGKPMIVSSHVGGSYVCGREFVFKSGDAKALRDKMELFLRDEQLLTEAGHRNRERYTKMATKDNAKKEINIYLKKIGVSGGDDKKNSSHGVKGEQKKVIKELSAKIRQWDKSLKNGDKAVVPIVFATDTNYAPFAAAVIRSVYENRDKDRFYSVYVLFDDMLTHRMYESLLKMNREGFSVRLVDVSECVGSGELYLSGHYSVQMYYRWLIPELFGHYDKVMYLDCDLAVLGDIAKLYDTDIGECYAGLVNNTVRTSFKYYVEENLGLPVEEYYNSGVILFNTKEFAEAHVKEKCVDFINRDRDLLCPDQDAINVCCRGHIFRLPDEWNFQWHHMIPGVETGGFTSDYKERYDRVLKKKPKIIHYTSYKKPWNEPELQLAGYFWKYFKKVPCYDAVMKRYAYGKKGIGRGEALSGSGRVEESVHYKERIEFLQNSLDETRNSVTYKIGRALTAVPRRVRHVLTGAGV